MDVSEYMESEFVTKETLENSKQKVFVILGVDRRDTKFGKRMDLKVGINGTQKNWTLSYKLVRQLAQHFGTDDEQWVNKVVSYQFVGKEIAFFPKEG